MNNVAASAAGAPLSSSQQVRNKKQREDESRLRRAGDAYEPTISEIEHIDAVRNLKDSTQEEAREDRQEHGIGYRKQRSKPGDPPRIDLNA